MMPRAAKDLLSKSAPERDGRLCGARSDLVKRSCALGRASSLMAGILVGTQIAGRALRAGLAPRRLGLAAATVMCTGAVLLSSKLALGFAQVLPMGASLLPIGLGLSLASHS
jgi:hypothetical protein